MKKVCMRYITSKFVNYLMFDGKKEKAEKVFLKLLDLLYLKEKQEGIKVFFQALKNSKPIVDLRSVRRGGAYYQVPVALNQSRSLSLAMKWIVDCARKRKGSFLKNLSDVLLESSKNMGDVVKKRDNLHMSALKNRSFTQYGWF